MKLDKFLEYLKDEAKSVIEIYIHLTEVEMNRRPLMKDLLADMIEMGLVELHELGDSVEQIFVWITDKGLNVLEALGMENPKIRFMVDPHAVSDVVRSTGAEEKKKE